MDLFYPKMKWKSGQKPKPAWIIIDLAKIHKDDMIFCIHVHSATGFAMNHQMIVGDSTLYFLKDEGYFSGCGYLGWPIDQGKLQTDVSWERWSL